MVTIKEIYPGIYFADDLDDITSMDILFNSLDDIFVTELFGGNGLMPSVTSMIEAAQLLPKNAMLNIIGSDFSSGLRPLRAKRAVIDYETQIKAAIAACHSV